MNFKSLILDICCDRRIKSGIFDFKNPDHIFVLQEYLEKSGLNIDTIVDKTASLFEAGRFPEKQAYNKDGLLVTFPSKEYRDRAVRKGTHFAENPKKAQTNIFTTSDSNIATQQEPTTVSLDQELSKSVEKSSPEQRTPQETEQDAQAVQSILTGELPLINFSVDEAISLGFINKGAYWYDSDDNLIGEQFYVENEGFIIKNMDESLDFSSILRKAKKTATVPEFNEILNKLSKLDSIHQTKLFETIPLLVLYNIPFENAKSLTGDVDKESLTILEEFGKLEKKLNDYYKSSISVAKFAKVDVNDIISSNITEAGRRMRINPKVAAKIAAMKKSPEKSAPTSTAKTIGTMNSGDSPAKIRIDVATYKKNLDAYNATYENLKQIGGNDSVSLKNILDKTPSDFFHNSISQFYAAAKVYNNISDESKEGTADIVLIYDGTKQDVITALRNNNVDIIQEQSVAKIKGKNTYFALVSLKAGKGRLGKILTFLKSYLDLEIEIQPSKEQPSTVVPTDKITENAGLIEESFLSVIKSSYDKFVNKYKEFSEYVKKQYQQFSDKFFNLAGSFGEKIKIFLGTFAPRAQQINDETLKDLKVLEDKILSQIDGDLSEKISAKCGEEYVEMTAALIENFEAYVRLLASKHNEIDLISKINKFLSDPNLIKYFPIEVPENFIPNENNIITAIKKEAIVALKRIINGYNSGKETCVKRTDISIIFKYRANIISLEYIYEILNKTLNTIKTSSPEEIQSSFRQLSALLTSEAIFGSNVKLPLIKFTGTKLDRLGTKQSYKISLPEKIDDLKMGKLKINVEGKSGEGKWLVVTMYLFIGIKDEDDNTKPQYVIYEFMTESGSRFTFKAEGKTITDNLD